MTRFALLFLLLGFPALAASPPCVPASSDTTEPWSYNHSVLGSFAAANVRPVFIGSFMDAAETYWVKLWRDEAGVFGEMSSPVFDADSPTSRLYDVQWNSATRQLAFSGRFPEGQVRFEGKLRARKLSGTVKRGPWPGTAVLRKLRHDEPVQWVSREQFECAMILFRRY